MKARIAFPAALVCLGLTSVRADEAPPVVTVDPTPFVSPNETVKMPEIAVCPLFPGEVNAELVQNGHEGVLPACDLPLPTITETGPATEGTDPVVDLAVIQDPAPIDPSITETEIGGASDPVVVVDITDQPAALDTETPVALETPLVLHLTGSEVQRGDGLVDPSLAYATGGPAPEAALASAVVSGTEAATALRVETTGAVIAAKRELTITRSGGEVVIGD